MFTFLHQHDFIFSMSTIFVPPKMAQKPPVFHSEDGLTYLGTVAWDLKTGSTSYTPEPWGVEGENSRGIQKKVEVVGVYGVYIPIIRNLLRWEETIPNF